MTTAKTVRRTVWQAKGKPAQDLEELEREKHEFVERIEAIWSA